MARTKMPNSIRTLAGLAEVSTVTAWRAVRGQYGVREDTRRKIEGLARKHGIPLSATPAHRTTNLLHTMCSLINIEAEEDQSPRSFNRRLLKGVKAGAASCGVETFNTEYAMDGASGCHWPLVINRKQVDGVVLVEGNEFNPFPAPLPSPVPVVWIFRARGVKSDSVTVANFNSARYLGWHLSELGHRRVAYIGSETEMSVLRLSGLRAGLLGTGGDVPREGTILGRLVGSREDAAAQTDQLLKQLRPGDPGPNGFTALMVYNDYMAAAAIMHLRKRGVRVPEQVSVVGFDNMRPSWYDGPPLTTAIMPLEEIGAEAARMLYWRLAHPDAPPRELLIKAFWIEGGTTRKAVGTG